MPRGGKRPGAGNKYRWKHGKTTVIRVPEALLNRVIEIAEALDSGHDVTISSDYVTLEHKNSVTQSKVIDLSRVAVRSCNGHQAVYISDLMRLGYEVKPQRLADSVRNRERKDRREQLSLEI